MKAQEEAAIKYHQSQNRKGADITADCVGGFTAHLGNSVSAQASMQPFHLLISTQYVIDTSKYLLLSYTTLAYEETFKLGKIR